METVEKNNGLFSLLQNGDKEKIKEAVAKMLPDELAHFIKDLPEGMQVLLFRNLDREKASQTFELLEVNLQEELLDILPHRQVALIINDIAPDVRTALLEELSA